MRKLFVYLMICGVFVLMGASPGFSQDKAKSGEAAYSLDEVVVTATKTQREVKDVPTDMAVLTQKEIEKYQPTDVMDLLRHVPGLVLNGMGSSKASFYAGSRGIQPSSRGMLIMMDGIEMNDPSNYLSVANIPLDRIERIEVIKTPASVLYGPAAVGGVINIITKKPVKPIESSASLLYGSFDTKQISANVAGLSENGFSYGLNYSYFDTDGYRNNNFRQQNAFTPKLGYVNDAIQFELFSNIVDGKYGFPGGLPVSSYQDDPTKALQTDREGNSVNSASGATLNWNISNQSQLKLKTSYRNNDWETEDYGLFFKGEDYWVWTGEAAYQYIASYGGVENTILVGTEYRKLHNEPSMYTDDHFGSKLLSQAEVSEQIVGVFIQDELRPVKDLMLNMGVRYDRIETDFENKLSAAASFDNSHEKWSPRLGATYTVSPGLNIFGNYSQGIRSVNLARSAFQLKSNVNPEKEESIEAGVRGLLLEIFEYNLAGFRINTKDKIIQKDRYLYENAGEARSEGVEMSITANLPHGTYITADYTRLDAEFTDFKTSSTTADKTVSYDGKKVPLVPENIFGLTLGWRSQQYGHISGSVRYVDEKFIDNANTLELDSYVVADLKYMYGLKNVFSKQDKLDFSIAVNNLFDKAYAEYGEANGGSYANFPVAFPADGRAVFASVGYSF